MMLLGVSLEQQAFEFNGDLLFVNIFAELSIQILAIFIDFGRLIAARICTGLFLKFHCSIPEFGQFLKYLVVFRMGLQRAFCSVKIAQEAQHHLDGTNPRVVWASGNLRHPTNETL